MLYIFSKLGFRDSEVLVIAASRLDMASDGLIPGGLYIIHDELFRFEDSVRQFFDGSVKLSGVKCTLSSDCRVQFWSSALRDKKFMKYNIY